MGCVGCAVILYKDKAGSLADVHFFAHLGAHMTGCAVQCLDGGLRAILAAHDAHVYLGHIQVRGHIQTGDSQKTALQPGVFQSADDGNDLALHVLRKAAHIFLRHSILLTKENPLSLASLGSSPEGRAFCVDTANVPFLSKPPTSGEVALRQQ